MPFVILCEELQKAITLDGVGAAPVDYAGTLAGLGAAGIGYAINQERCMQGKGRIDRR